MAEAPLSLALDAGGTATRWALARTRPDGGAELLAEGELAGFSALQMATPEGRAHVAQVLASLAQALRPHGLPQQVLAGVTGQGAGPGPLRAALAATLGLPELAVQLMSDIELACRAHLAPGEGVLVYAGTGSIAAFIDAGGRLHRAGGRGGLIDDAGGGHWIAVEALRALWRAEDAEPGAWQRSPLARALLQRVGGSEWAHTRALVARGDRGEIGRLALAVAEAAEADPAARALLQRAGDELARLARCLLQRTGTPGSPPVVLTGRVFTLHPIVAQRLAQALPGVPLRVVTDTPTACAAARRAAARTDPDRTEPPCC